VNYVDGYQYETITSSTTATPTPTPKPSPTPSPTPKPSSTPSPTPTPALSGYFVSPSGSDSNSGTLISAPFQTLERAQQAMRSSSLKTTYLLGGTYSRSASLQLGASDAGESWLAYPGQTPVLDGSGITATAIVISGTSKVTVRWLTIRNFVSSAFGLYKSTGLTLDSNTIYNMTGAALSGGAFTSKGIGIVIYGALISSTLSHNLIYNTTTHAIHLTPYPQGTPNQNVTIDSNLIHDVNTYPGLLDTGGIYINDRPHTESNIVVSNNEVYNYGNPGPGGARGIYLDDESSNITIFGNTIAGSGSRALQIHGGDHIAFYNNVFDVSHASDGVGLYQDDVSSGFANYGMQSNVFHNNTVYMDCNTTPNFSSFWLYADATNVAIAMLSDSSNTYYNLSSSIVNGGPVKDSSPTYKTGCVSLATLAPGLSGVGPLGH